eukprot:PITA_30352
MDISLLDTVYQYVVKIEQNFKQKKRDFGSANPKEGKGAPKPLNKGQSQGWVAQANPPKPQEKNNTSSESDLCSNSQPEPDKRNDKGKHIIDAEPNATVATTKIHKEEPEDPEEEECIFHSQMWVKGSLLQFIVDSGSQKNLILVEVVKRLGLSTRAHPQPFIIGWIHQGRDLRVSQQCHLPYNIKPFTDEVLCDVAPLDVCDVLLCQPYLWK